MVGPVQWVNKEEQPEAHHRQKMTEYRAARGCGDYVVSDGDSKRRHEEADGIMNPETAERCAPRAGNELRYKIPDRIGEHCEGDAADNVPSTDIQVGEPSFQECQEGVAQPSEEYALRVVVAKPAPGKPSVASQKFWKGELGGHQNAEQDRDH